MDGLGNTVWSQPEDEENFEYKLYIRKVLLMQLF